MLILNGSQVRQWDQYTIDHGLVTSIELMEKAASGCAEWLMSKFPSGTIMHIFCGKGNNGGDGLAIARILSMHEYKVAVYILEFGHLGSDDFQENLQRLHTLDVEIRFISEEGNFPHLESPSIIIDALYGSGLNRPLNGLSAALVEHINLSLLPVISIDVPSGLYTDLSSKGNTVITAQETLSFQCLKPAFLVAENEVHTGSVTILDIGLDPGFLKNIKQPYVFVDQKLAHDIYRPRKKFSHKGIFGHALLVAGSYGKMGAAVLAARACTRTGVGLITTLIPRSGYEIMQLACPEAMVITSEHNDYIDNLPRDLQKYATIVIGPGLGTAPSTALVVKQLITQYEGNLVIDADGLNVLSKEINTLKNHKARMIITPHPKEMERLFGAVENDFERIEQAIKNARELNMVIVLKGRYTCITTPGGMTYFNSTGNPGLAKGGTGDTLTGMIGALIANGYSAEAAAILGCYLHGKAADIVAENSSEESLTPSDLIEEIGRAFRAIS